MIVEAQATPRLARKVIAKVREITDKPISHLVLTHYHAVRVLGASAYGAGQVVMSDAARAMVAGTRAGGLGQRVRPISAAVRGARRDPRPDLADDHLRRPDERLSRQAPGRHLIQLGRAHTAGDAVIYVPDQNVMFTGDIVEYRSACYCGDGHYGDWPGTLQAIRGWDLDAIAPGRGDALVGRDMVDAALASTADFVTSTYRSVARVALGGGTLREAMDCRAARPAIPSSPTSRSTNIACRSTSPAPMTRRRASTRPASGPPSATAGCGTTCRAEADDRARAARRPLPAGLSALPLRAVGRSGCRPGRGRQCAIRSW